MGGLPAKKQSVGVELTVSNEPPGGKGMTFKPKVLVFEPGKEFRWKGKLGIKGIFNGEHYFKLIGQDDWGTKFIHGEIFSGIVVPLMGKTSDQIHQGFNLMNRPLKAA